MTEDEKEMLRILKRKERAKIQRAFKDNCKKRWNKTPTEIDKILSKNNDILLSKIAELYETNIDELVKHITSERQVQYFKVNHR